MQSIEIVVEGRLPSHKNSYQLVNGRMIRNRDLVSALNRLGWAARAAIGSSPYEWPLPPKTPLFVRVDVYVSGLNSPDIDGIVTTVLDGLEGQVYHDDKYATRIEVCRHLVWQKKEECVVITVTELPVEVLAKQK